MTNKKSAKVDAKEKKAVGKNDVKKAKIKTKVDELTDSSVTSVPNHPETICMNFQSFFKGMVSALNPDYEFAYSRMITKGDNECHWTIKKKQSSRQVDDPLKVLKLRFAKGEITKEEYEELKAMLVN
jgi:predicted hydrocarbon binding protein